MPIPQQRDPEWTRRRLTAWLAERLPGATDLHLSPFEVPPGTGFSNETVLFDACWRAGGERHRERLVARIQPDAYQVFRDPDVIRQYRLMAGMAAHGVPVARMRWAEPDPTVIGAPFFIMDRVEGRAAPDVPNYNTAGWIADLAPAQRQRLWRNAMDVLVAIHRVNWREGFDFLNRPEDGRPGLEQYLRHIARWYAWSSRGRPQPVADVALAWVLAHRPAAEPPVGVCWGDARIGNILFRDDLSVGAVCDWEMATLGPAEVDLGWWLFLDAFHSWGAGVARLEGLPGRAATIAHYETLLGRRVRDLPYYEVLAGLRFAMVIQRITALRVEYGLAPPGTDVESPHNPVIRVLARLLDDVGARRPFVDRTTPPSASWNTG
jgi:aminoglycoside phosphotransferase (APT) family kinase protein